MRIRRYAVAAAALGALVLAGCGGETEPDAAGSPTPTTASPTPAATSASPTPAATTSAPAPTPVEDATGKACAANKKAFDDDKSTDWKTMEAVAKLAQKATDEGVALQGRLMAEQVAMTKIAVRQKADDATAQQIRLMTANIELSTACVRAGYLDS